MDYLRKNTRYDEQEIREWYKGFKVRTQNLHFAKHCCNVFDIYSQVDCPDGQLSKTKILDMYSMILPAGNAQVNAATNCF